MAGQGGGAASLSEQIVSYISYPFASCLPSSSARNSNNHERQGLLSDSNYDDSDAISLLSNIRDRSRRRSRSSRRREEWSKRAAVVGCGLFGRPKGQIARREVTGGDVLRAQHRRSASEDSAASIASYDNSGPALSASGSFTGAQESGDEDAGMLGDEDIAEISQSRDDDVEGQSGEAQGDVPSVHISAAEEESEEQREAKERAAIKAKLDRDAEEYAKTQAEDAAKLAAEEEALAAEEEAAIAKAKRKAERRAIKEGLIKVRNESQRERRRTEAEAEAAAGGFDFAEEHPREYDYRQEEDPPRYAMTHEEEYGYHDQQMQDEYPQQPEIVHHHHYYHKPQPEEEVYDDSLLSPNFRIQELPSFPSAGQDTKETTFEEDEDDADIAGITFSKSKKSRPRGGEGGSQTHSNGRSAGSGSGSRQSGSASGQGQSRYEAHRRASDQSGEGGSGAGGGSSGSGKKSYRDRPRRHERTGSRSTGSGPGPREGVPSRSMARSPTIAESEDRAEAAAGGFDDFVPPQHAFTDEQGSAGYRARERRSFGEQGSSSSSGQRRERQREGPAKREGGLNKPRNPLGANVFV